VLGALHAFLGPRDDPGPGPAGEGSEEDTLRYVYHGPGKEDNCATISLGDAGMRAGEKQLTVLRNMLGALAPDPGEVDIDLLGAGVAQNIVRFEEFRETHVLDATVAHESVTVKLPSSDVRKIEGGGQQMGDSVFWLSGRGWDSGAGGGGGGGGGMVSVTYRHKGMLLEGGRVKRTIAVPMRGRVRVSEGYEVRNAAAAIHGHFDRLAVDQYGQRRRKSMSAEMLVIDTLVLTAPPKAEGLSYSDRIGRIFTSKTRHLGEYTVFQLEPRYVISGGQRASFTVGYTLPKTDWDHPQMSVLKKDTTGQHFPGAEPLLVDVTLGPSLADISFDSCELEINLPRGARALRVSAPGNHRVVHGTHHWPLDFRGSPRVTVLMEHCTPQDLLSRVTVHFEFSRWYFASDPLLLSLLGLLLAVALAPRVALALLSRLLSTQDPVLLAVRAKAR